MLCYTDITMEIGSRVTVYGGATAGIPNGDVIPYPTVAYTVDSTYGESPPVALLNRTLT
jgi:hypothetical protein